MNNIQLDSIWIHKDTLVNITDYWECSDSAQEAAWWFVQGVDKHSTFARDVHDIYLKKTLNGRGYRKVTKEKYKKYYAKLLLRPGND